MMRTNKIKDDQFEQDDTPQVRDSGEFFLARYRRVAADTLLLDKEFPKHALRMSLTGARAKSLATALGLRGAKIAQIPWLRRGWWCSAPFSLGATPEYLRGEYYLQGPLSQLACEVLDPEPGSRVLDMAAAPGSKTTYLAQLIGDGGAVVALDSDATRLAAVRNNAERLALANVLCIRKDARFATDLGEKFRFVLLDAPCSGNMCSEEGWSGKRTMQHVQSNARTQRELLKAAVGCLAPGGRLVYSTCSLEPEEDECIVSWLLERYAQMEIVPLGHLPVGDAGITSWEGKQLDPRVAGTRRFWPQRTDCEGFYIALLESRS